MARKPERICWPPVYEGLEFRLFLSGDSCIALIDRTLAGHDLLASAAGANLVIRYDGSQDSPTEVLSDLIDQAESRRIRIQSLAIFSHGGPGQFALGNEIISLDSLSHTADAWARLGAVMAEGGALRLYACDLADPSGTGQALLNRLAEFTGAKVYASDDLTGAGGDWVLEAASRGAEGEAAAGQAGPLDTQKLVQWDQTLANNDPVITSSSTPSVAENQTAVLTVTATDPDLPPQTITFSITGGADSDKFSIDGASGDLTFDAAPDFENPTDAGTDNVYEVEVTADDGNGGTDVQAISVTVTDLNEAPTVNDDAFALDENAANGTVVGTPAASDPDAGDSLTYSITGGNTDNAFAIDSSTGEITVNNGSALDYETNPTFDLTVQVEDNGALTDTATVTVNLNDLNEAPTVNDDAFSLHENTANGTVVGTPVASDPDAGDSLTYSITGGNTDNAFAIDSSTGQITVNNSSALDYETNPTFDLTVQVEDTGALTDTASVTVSLNDIDEAVSFADETSSAGLSGIGNTYGIAWGDYNNDGYPDLYVSTGNSLYKNDGDGTFSAGPSVSGNGRGTHWGDYDNDGDLDFAATVNLCLSRNNGDGSFTLQNNSALGLTSISNLGDVAWLDYNRDGHPDLWAPNGSSPYAYMYRGDGDGTFTAIDGDTIGLAADTNGESTIVADYDGDGYTDILYRAGSVFLWHNDGDGTFTDVTGAAGVSLSGVSGGYNGTAFGDYDNDGDLDLYGGQAGANKLYRNNNDGTFTDVTATAGVAGSSATTQGVAWGDYNHDGDLDLYVAQSNGANHLYHNNGDGTFTDVASAYGLDDGSASYGAVWADYDLDGDLDLFVGNNSGASKLFRNGLNDAAYLKVKASGFGGGFSPRDGTGARVELYDAAGTTLLAVREVFGGEGYGSHSPRIQHFGLDPAWGDAGSTYTVRVVFASGVSVTRGGVVPEESSITIGSATLSQTVEIVDADPALIDHTAGQEPNAFAGAEASLTDAELFAFQLVPLGDPVTVSEVVVSLSDVSGLTDLDWAGVELVTDTDGDGTIGTGETTAVGGGGTVDQAAGTITFSDAFDVSAATNYILRADFASLSGGDEVTIGLTADNVTSTGTVAGAASEATHRALVINYRSIGTNAGVLYAAGTASAAAGSTTVNLGGGASLPANIGPGDVLILNPGPSQEVLYILSRDSATRVTVQAAPAGTHTDVAYTITRAHNTIQAWETDRQGDLAADSRREVGVCYNDGAFDEFVTIDGSTTDAEYYMRLTVAPGQRHDGTAGTGVILEPTGAGHAIQILDDYTRVEWIEITDWSTDTAGSYDGINIRADNALVEYALVHDDDNGVASNSDAHGITLELSNMTATVRNCIVYNIARSGITIHNIGGATLNVANCTVLRCTQDDSTPGSYGGVGRYGGRGSTINARNVISMDAENGGDFCGSDWGTSSNNLSSDGTAPGADSLPNRTTADQFLSPGAGSEDLHLKSGSDAIDAGTSLSGEFNDDVDETLRPVGVTWDIGADEINQPPVIDDQGLPNVDENSAGGTVVGTVAAGDPDAGDSVTYSITGGNTDNAFAIDGSTGEITVNNASALDYETNPTFALTVQVADTGALTDTATVTVDLNDLNEAPTVGDQAFGVDENAANGSVVGTVAASDPDAGDSLTYSITAGNTDDAFAIDAATGEITVNNASALDYETNPSFSLTVQVEDTGSLLDTAAVTVDLNDLNEAPTVNDQSFAVDENSPDGTVVGTVVASDPDPGDSLTYSIAGGNTNSAFAIGAGTGEITVHNSGALNYETKPTFSLAVQVKDSGAPGLTDTATVTITLNDVNEAPVVNDHSFGVAESAPDGTQVGTVAAVDPDAGDTLTYAITGGNTDNAFAIDSSTGEITVNNSTALDYGTNPTFNLAVEVTDSGTPVLSDTATVTINVSQGNEPPQINNQSFSLDENAANGTVVGTVLASDPDAGDTLTYAITGGNTDGAFAVNSTTGEITVSNSSAVDYEANHTFYLTVWVTDDGTPALSDTAMVTVGLNDLNEAPAADDQSFAAAENVPNGTVVGTVVADDPDAGDTLTYAITDGNTDNAFAINSSTGEITVNNSAALDYETNPTFALTVQVEDTGALTDTAAVTIDLNDLNEAPAVPDQAFGVAEDAADGTAVGTVLASDPDAGDSLTYSITAGNDDGVFEIDPATGQIAVADSSTLDYETLRTYDLTVRVEDAGGQTDTAAVTIDVTDVNDRPVVATTPVDLAYTEGDGAVAVDGGLTVSDVDSADLAGASVAISSGYVEGEDALSFTDQLGITGDWDAAAGVLTLTGTASLASYQTALRSVTYTNHSGAPSEAARTARFVVSDGDADSDAATRDMTVAGRENDPVAGDDQYNMAEDGVLTVEAASGTLSNDSDADGDPLSAVLVGDVSHGTLDLHADGSFTYAPHGEWNGSDSFTYVATDGRGDSNVATAAITVAAVNDAPVSTVPGPQITFGPGPVVFSAGLGRLISVSDLDAGAGDVEVTVTAANGRATLAGAAGLTFLAGDGTADATMAFTGTVAAVNEALDGVTFRADQAYAGPAELRITVDDQGNTGQGGSLVDTQVVAITVREVPDTPDTPEPTPPDTPDSPDLPDPPLPPDPPAPSDDGSPTDSDGTRPLVPTPVPPAPPQPHPGGPALDEPDPDEPEPESAEAAPAETQPQVAAADRPVRRHRTPRGPALDRPKLDRATPELARTDGQIPSFRDSLARNEFIRQELDRLKDQMTQSGGDFSIGAATGMSSALVAGYVIWMLRSASPLAGLLSAVPLSAGLDPLPILAGSGPRRRKRNGKGDPPDRDPETDEEDVGELLDPAEAPRAAERKKGERP